MDTINIFFYLFHLESLNDKYFFYYLKNARIKNLKITSTNSLQNVLKQ